MRAHVDHAFQSEFRTDRRGRHPMLPRTRLGDDARLAHAARKNDLAQHVVDLVRARVVQLVALEIDFRAAKALRHPFGEVKRAEGRPT